MTTDPESIFSHHEFWDFDRYRSPDWSPPSVTPGPASTDRGVWGGAGTKPEIDPLNPFSRAAADFDPKPDFDADPHRWGIEKTGEFFWSAQTGILISLACNRYTAVQSCHDSGKSFIAARAMLKWLDQYEPGEAFIVSTAPTSAQVSAILWRELQKAHKKGAFKGTITTAGYPQYKIGGELVGYGRKPADYAVSAFSGIHARYVLVVIDEACGVDEALFNQIDALVTNVNARVLAIGNPDDPTSHFARICKPNSGWTVIRIDGLRTPNFTQDAVEWLDCPHCRQLGRERPLLVTLFEDENLPYSEEYVPEDIRDMLLSPLWVEERLHRWVGVPDESQTLSEISNQSALFVSKVRGLFPDSSSEGVVPLGWVERAMGRYEDWVADGRPPQPVVERHVLGVDVADQGEDQTVISFREGWITMWVRKYRNNPDPMETAGYVIAAMSSRPASTAIVDSIGVGSGTLARLREQGVSCIGFVASGSAKGMKDKTGEFQFTNLRSAAWWRMRELLDPTQPGGSPVMLPRSESLLGDLATPHYKVLSGGKIQVEPKDDIRKRLGRSTDEGDAVVMSYWRGRGRVDTAQEGVVSWWDEPADGAIPWGVDEMAGAEGYVGG